MGLTIIGGKTSLSSPPFRYPIRVSTTKHIREMSASLVTAFGSFYRPAVVTTGVTKVKESFRKTGIPFPATKRKRKAFIFVAKRVAVGLTFTRRGIRIAVLKVINRNRIFIRAPPATESRLALTTSNTRRQTPVKT